MISIGVIMNKNIFESCKHIDDNGIEYWNARSFAIQRMAKFQKNT